MGQILKESRLQTPFDRIHMKHLIPHIREVIEEQKFHFYVNNVVIEEIVMERVEQPTISGFYRGGREMKNAVFTFQLDFRFGSGGNKSGWWLTIYG